MQFSLLPQPYCVCGRQSLQAKFSRVQTEAIIWSTFQWVLTNSGETGRSPTWQQRHRSQVVSLSVGLRLIDRDLSSFNTAGFKRGPRWWLSSQGSDLLSLSEHRWDLYGLDVHEPQGTGFPRDLQVSPQWGEIGAQCSLGFFCPYVGAARCFKQHKQICPSNVPSL